MYDRKLEVLQSFPVYLSPLSLIFCPLLDSEATTKTALRMILPHPNSDRPFAATWYKIRHAGGQAHYCSRTGTLKQRDLNQ